MRDNLKDYEKSMQADVVEVETYFVADTIVKSETKKKNFWKKLASAFSSKQDVDTIMTLSKEVIDTVMISPRDINYTTTKRDNLLEKVSADYKTHIANIEEQVILLIISDHEISTNISNLLIGLYENLLESSLYEIKQNEAWLRRNNTISIFIGLIALTLILFCILFIINDVNKGLHMRKSLEIANIRTKQLMESRHQLLLSVSHDIKTPLNSILGYLELSTTQNQLTIQDLTSMRNSGRYILALLENLLEFSSLQLGTLTANKTTVHLTILCNEIKEMFIPLAKQKGLNFECIYEFEKDLNILSDNLKLKQIIINILSNAIKYTMTGKIQFIVRFEKDRLFLHFSDTGIGIPEMHLNKIFDPFIRVDENKNIAEGTGFGMYVVKGLVELLNGRIAVASIVNKGTDISIELPAPIGYSGEHQKLSSLNIHIIDDDPAFSNLLNKMLTQLGHSVVTSNSLADFEKSIRDISTFDLIMTDMEMGELSGNDILKAIRMENTSLPVFVITGRSNFNEEQAQTMGFTGFIPKPVTLKDLIKMTNLLTKEDEFLAPLRDMFGEDIEAIKEIIEIFIQNTTNNLLIMEKCFHDNNCQEAQAICHKMFPMFIQMGQNSLARYLKKMDKLRGTSSEVYKLWKKDGINFIREANNFLEKLKIYLSSL